MPYHALVAVSLETTGFADPDLVRLSAVDLVGKMNKFDQLVMPEKHIDERVKLLIQCKELFSPRAFLIRVPMYQRDWRVPLMDELGVDYRLDPEHFIEFTPETFAAEMDSAELRISHVEYRWGEIWSCLEPKST